MTGTQRVGKGKNGLLTDGVSPQKTFYFTYFKSTGFETYLE